MAPPSPAARVEPLTAEARRLHITVSKRFLEKLEVARNALSHARPDADAEAILEAGLDLLIQRAATRKGICARPRTSAKAERAERANSSSGAAAEVAESSRRHIAAAVKREVLIRDEGRCQWPMERGGICGSTHRLQFDHIVPVGRGGTSTTANLRLCCAFHNDLAARQVYGDEWMDRFTRCAGRLDRRPATRG